MAESAPEFIAAFLEVGQGDATVVVAPTEGVAGIIDCPHGKAPVVLDFLEAKRVRKLQMAMVTHSDLDHAGGIVDVIRNFAGPTECLAAFPDRPAGTTSHDKRRYGVLLREFVLLWRQGVSESIPLKGTCWSIGPATAEVLHPTQADFTDAVRLNKRNEASAVVRIGFQDLRILLSADVGRQGWQWMIDRHTDLKANVLKVPHHGAWHEGNPSLVEILDLVSPTFAVISVGSGNSYGHPATETFRALKMCPHCVRFLCTQATIKCDKGGSVLASPQRGGVAGASSCRCAGTVTVQVRDGTLSIDPDAEEHGQLISHFTSPQCRVVA